MRESANYLLSFGLCASLIVMFTGIIVYTAKIGGLSDAQYIFLFLSMHIQTHIQDMIITLDRLGYLIAIGRYVFPYFLLMIAFKYSTIPFIFRHIRWMNLTALLPVVSLVLYYPQIFYVIVRNRFTLQRAMMTAMPVWILVYLLVAVALMIREYFEIPVKYFRRQFRNILFLDVSLAVLYVLHCFQDPIQVYQLYGSQYLWVSGFSYANPAMPLFGWVALTALMILFSVLGLWNLIRYTQVNYQTNQEEIVLQRKFDSTSAGVSVFVHSIKNQLLSSGVVYKRTSRLLEQETPDLEALKENINLLAELNNNMLAHINRLYVSTKSHSISLTPVSVDDIAELAIQHFHEKYPEGKVDVTLSTHASVLADKASLSEAIYNLLTNAQEAILYAGRSDTGRIELKTYNGRIYTFFEVSDNGGGISKNEQKKIFDPLYTTKNTNVNWGMGLHYVKRIAKSHYGNLRFQSTPGEGTSFFLTLPRYDPHMQEGHYPAE